MGSPVVVLAGVGDPGNAGTVIRSAAATGAAGVLLTPGSVDPTNPKVVRASAGALFALPVATVDDVSALGLATVGAVAGGLNPDEVDLSGPVALVLGGEAAGLPEDVLFDTEVALPAGRRCRVTQRGHGGHRPALRGPPPAPGRRVVNPTGPVTPGLGRVVVL